MQASGLNRRRLRLWLALFFLALAVPTAILIHRAYSQLKWEAFHQYQTLAEELARRIDARILALIDEEETRSFSDYGFLVVAGDPSASFLQRSPLSDFPAGSRLPGLLGYFQVDADGVFSTPLLPSDGAGASAYGISVGELDRRREQQGRILQILSRNRLLGAAKVSDAEGEGPAEAAPGLEKALVEDELAATSSFPRPDGFGGRGMGEDVSARRDAPAQAAFDKLNRAYPGSKRVDKKAAVGLGRVEDLNLDLRFQRELDDASAPVPVRSAPQTRARSVRKERSALPEPRAPAKEQQAEQKLEETSVSELRISIFESELDPFELSLLDSGHLVLFRKVWRDGQRYIQGAVIEQGPFLSGLVEAAFRETALSRMSELLVAYRGAVLSAFTAREGRDYLSSASELTGALLYRTRLSAPVSDLELIFSVSRLPAGPGAGVVTWVAAALVLVLCGGFLLMYRLGLKQIALARQQQDFVSAVSHELKTPLTSIRMYGEMLREGWADDARKGTYYDFICDESERLTRLINNVLQLARLTRNELRVDVRPIPVVELMGTVRPKVATQIERAGFKLRLDCDETAATARALVDADFFAQILINLVDNAVKFSREAKRKVIEIGCRVQSDGTLQVAVRDYGPGIPRDQMKNIFRLFYRSGNELTRETVGTGIGLALVRQLALAMGGQVDLVDAAPGAEFRLRFPTERRG